MGRIQGQEVMLTLKSMGNPVILWVPTLVEISLLRGHLDVPVKNLNALCLKENDQQTWISVTFHRIFEVIREIQGDRAKQNKRRQSQNSSDCNKTVTQKG
jgi:hypothetical protein